MRDPFSRSRDYLAAIDGASFSPTDAIRASVDSAPAILPEDASVEQRRRFIVQVMRSAAAVTLAYTRGNAVTVSTNASVNDDKGTLILDADAIVALARTSPQQATDYATGRMLTQASAFEQFRKPEIVALRKRLRMARHLDTIPAPGNGQTPVSIAGVSTYPDEVHAHYSGAHLAAGVAAMRGREKVLKAWPGWAGYFAAAEQSAKGAGALADYVADPKHPAIRRAAASLLARLQGVTIPEDPALVPAVDAGEQAARTSKGWKPGSMLDTADAVVSTMARALPAPEPQQHQGDGNESGDQGEPSDSGDEDRHAIPDSEADAAKGGYSLTMNGSEVQQEVQATTPGGIPTGGTPGVEGSFPESRQTVEPNLRELPRLQAAAAPMVASLQRVAWETLTPPQFDRAQVTGDLDEGALHRLAAWGDPEVFEQRQESGQGRVAVALLVDCSGSMRGSCMADAQAVAYALAKVFGASPRYALRIVGHDIGYGPRRLRLFDCPSADAISGLQARGDNADGFAIAAVMRDLERIPAARRIVLLMADGAPNATGYHGNPAADHIRRIVESGAQRGTEFLALGIEGAMSDGSGRRMFGASRFVSLPDTRSAGPLLGRVLARLGREASV
jgi:hypothetical protein